MTNNEILEESYSLLQQCVNYQARKYGWLKYTNDIIQDMCVIILDYDNEKLNQTYKDKHLNAFYTGILVRQLNSRNSPAYKKYKKDNDRQVSISEFYDI